MHRGLGALVFSAVLVAVWPTPASAMNVTTSSGGGGGNQDAGTSSSLSYNQALIAVSLVCGILLGLNLLLCPLAVVLAAVKRKRQQRKKELAQARKELLERQETWYQENETDQLVQRTGSEEDPAIRQTVAAES